MAKACCVVEMPQRCANCVFRCSIEFGKPFCYVTTNDVNPEEYYEIKPEWCPLKPMPEKREPNPLSDSNYFDAMGWNACIDAICGKE